MDIKIYLDQIKNVFIKELNNNLVGVYLHGSLAMGCFNPDKSDVDLLVIVKEELSITTQKSIIKELLQLTENKCPPIEMSIVLEKFLSDFIYPTPFELHFFHPKYLKDNNYICGGKEFVDPDLAGHIVVTYHRGVALYGKEIKDIFVPIDNHYYLESIFNDIEDAREGIMENPVYHSLNLCRVMYYLKEGKVSSKREGGEWGMRNLPANFKRIVEQSLNVYNGNAVNVCIKNEDLLLFADWMLRENKFLRLNRR